MKAEFPHRSIQEFFVTIHCYHLMQEKQSITTNVALAISIQYLYPQVEQFFFGVSSICSWGWTFEQVVDWISEPVLNTEFYMIDYII